MTAVLDDIADAEATPPVFPVSEADQARNVLLFGAMTALYFLASPVMNIGRLHSPVCTYFGASNAVANLPSSAYLMMSVAPLILAGLFPRVSSLKRVLTVCYCVLAVMAGAVAVALVLPVPNWFKIAVVILQGAVCGICLTTAVMFLMEVISRGADPTKRGRALSLGYGRGPILGLLAALGLQLSLQGSVFGLSLPPIPKPWNFALPFALAVPIMGLAAWLSTKLVIPIPADDANRRPSLMNAFAGIGEFLSHRWLLLTFIIGAISWFGFSIGQNMTLYTKQIIGVPAETFVGYQLALRFGFKILSGLCMGIVLSRFGPRATMMVTAFCAAAGIAWAMLVPGYWFMLGFGLLGAGELHSIYLTNYILSCSSEARTRNNMGFASLTMLPAAPAGAFLGYLADHYGAVYTKSFGFQLSFAVALGFMGLVLLITPLLPAHPERQPEPK